MKLTALFNKIKYRNPTALQAWDVLRMATIEGAQAIGLGNEVGSIEVGKKADLILIDLRSPNLVPNLQSPIRTIVPNLVYAATGREVTFSMVDGRILMRDGKVQTLDESAIVSEAQAQAEQLAARVLADPVHKGMALLDAMERGLL